MRQRYDGGEWYDVEEDGLGKAFLVVFVILLVIGVLVWGHFKI